MACEKSTAIKKRKVTANEKYLSAMFTMLRKRENIIVADKKARFNDTELRLLTEILHAKYRGERLISTQLATMLGITRSAVSQIVNRLEEEGVVKRVADDVDRKIAYIEVTDETLEYYQQDIKACMDFAGRVVNTMGKEKFNTLCALVDEFCDVIEQEKSKLAKKKK